MLAVCVSSGDISVAFDVVAGRAAWGKVVKAMVATGIKFKYVIDGIGIWFAAICTVRFVG